MAEAKTTEKAGGAAKPAPKSKDGAAEVLAKISATPSPYREMEERLHALILDNAPSLQPKLWYGMPAYAKDGKIVCFFRAPWANEKHDYMTFGLTENANLRREEGAKHQLLASAWYFTGLDEATEAELAAIVRGAVGPV